MCECINSFVKRWLSWLLAIFLLCIFILTIGQITLPYFIGYAFAIVVGFCFHDLIYREIWREIPTDSTDDDRELHRYYGGAIGFWETILYVTAFLQNPPIYGVIGIWLAFKVAGRWERSKIEFERNKNKSRLYLNAIYSNFTIGNALSIIYAFIGSQIIKQLQINNIQNAFLLTMAPIIISTIFLLHTKKQSKRIKEFYSR